MQKIQPSKNTINMDFLNNMDKSIGAHEKASVPLTQSAPQNTTVINPVSMEITEPVVDNITEIESNESDSAALKNLKETQIVMRVSEKEKEAMKAYFMKHGVSLSKGLKIAVKYLEQQELKGQVHFSDIGLF